MDTFTQDKKILIVGLGLIGASYAQGLSAAGYEVGAMVRRQQTLDYALSHGYVRHGRTDVDPEYLSEFDIVIFALYPKVFERCIEEYQDCFKEGAIISDVTGVKTSLLSRIVPKLRKDLRFVPAHPMAGRECSGVESADCGIFRNANFIITPVESSDEDAIACIREMSGVLGFKRVSMLSPEEHDEMIGFLSQLTHCIAVALMDCKDSSRLVEYTGDSFRDLTRIARINEDMWTELFLENRKELLAQMNLFMEKFSLLRDALAACDADTMKDMMRLSTERRAYFDIDKEL